MRYLLLIIFCSSFLTFFCQSGLSNEPIVKQFNSLEKYQNNNQKDSLYKIVSIIGKDFSPKNSYYKNENYHNYYNFIENPFCTTDPKKINENINYSKRFEELNSFLNGIVILKQVGNVLENRLNNYPKPNWVYKYSNISNSRNSQKSCYFDFEKSDKIYLINSEEKAQELKEYSIKHCPGYQLDIFHCSNYIFFINNLNCEKFESKIEKSIKNKSIEKLSIESKDQFLLDITGLNKEYFSIENELNVYRYVIRNLESHYIIKLPINSDNFASFNYIGENLAGQPKGFGLLLSENNELILSANWENSIPSSIYELFTYHGNSSYWRNHRFIINNSNSYSMIDLNAKIYTNDISSFNLYIGSTTSETPRQRQGYGNYFFENWDKIRKSYSYGNWLDGQLNGDANLFSDGYTYSGRFNNGALSEGTCLWPNNTKYIGQFSEYKMNGFGKLIDPNKSEKIGFFENNQFVQTLEEYNLQKQQSIANSTPSNTQTINSVIKNEITQKKTPIKVDAYDFMDYPEKYIGKSVILTVFYSNDNETVIFQPETMENTNEMYYDYLCQCLKSKDPYAKVGKHAVHWKKFIEVTNVSTITVNIPKTFFNDNKIPENFGKGHLDIVIDVYSGESRESTEKGVYSENRNKANFELVSIKRHKY